MRAWKPLLGVLAASQVAYGRRAGIPAPAETRAIVGLMLATATAEAVAARGAARGPALLGAAGAVGFAAEVAGVASGRPFGRYRYSDRLGTRVAGVPLLAAAAWALLARPSWAVAGLLSRRRAPRVALAAAALTAWDVFLDPRMVREGYWTWRDGGRYEGVPASNFAGWFVTAAAIFAVFALTDARDDPAADDDGAIALYVWTWAGETVANTAVWRRPRVALAGGLSMGAFAIPALVSRRRRS
jgi:uncharacterized membrane protein